MSDGFYFQLPLCALSYGATVEKRIEDIIGYSAIEAGRSKWFALPSDQKQMFKDRMQARAQKPCDFKPSSVDSLAAM